MSFISAARFLVCVSMEIRFNQNIVIWDSVVGIVTALPAGRTDVWILAGREFSSYPPAPRLQPPVHWVLRLLSLEKVARA
jgi:hypothetical protein